MMLTYEKWLNTNNDSGETNEVNLEQYYYESGMDREGIELEDYMDKQYEHDMKEWNCEESGGRMLLKMKEQARLSREAREAVEARREAAVTR
jgi:hypothetical protein